jgi:MFS family permease
MGSYDHRVTARSVTGIVVGVVAVVWSGYLAWFAVTGLLDEPLVDAWFYVVALAVVPLFWALAVEVPQLLAARTPEERTSVLFARRTSVFTSLSMFGLVVAVAVAIGSWAWSIVLVACGGVLALQNADAMRTTREIVVRDPSEPVATETGAPSRRDMARLGARILLFLISIAVVAGSVGYAFFGRPGALVALGLVGVTAAWGSVTVARAVRRGGAERAA